MVLGIYGASGLGMETEGLVEKIFLNEPVPRWEDVVFIDDDEEKMGTTLVDREVITFKEAIKRYTIHGIEFVISLGEPALKDKVFAKLEEHGALQTNIIDPALRIPKSVEMGKSCIIRSTPPPCAKLGNCVLLQGMACMGHNLVAGDNVTISSLAFVGGDVTIGKNTYIAPSSTIRNDVKIGENAIVGMGAVVTKDVPDRAVVYGNPAKIMRYNDSGTVF